MLCVGYFVYQSACMVLDASPLSSLYLADGDAPEMYTLHPAGN